MSRPGDEKLVDLLARREADPRTAAATEVDPGLGKALRACSSVERELSTLALVAEGHPDRAGPWVLLRPIGRGGAGTVYLAEHEDSGERAAVRCLTSLDGDGPADAARRALEWKHDGVIPTLGVGEDWIASELSDGVPLATVLTALRRDPAAEPGETLAPLLRALAPVCEALGEAHERGLVHAGVSPSKLDLGADGGLRIRDFGFDPTRAGCPPTPDRPPLGSPHHLAPEQAGAGGGIGPATDVYAFGSVVWTVAAGRPPHNDRSLTGLLRRIREKPLPSSDALAATVTSGLVGAVRACLAKASASRPTSLRPLAGLLAAVK